MSEAEGTQTGPRRARPIAYRVLPISGCHICTSHARNDTGYPEIRRGGRTMLVVRHLYEEAHGAIPEGLVLRHECDTPACINLAHVTPGTHADNVADRVKRNRSARGEQNGRAKLTPRKVRAIKRSKQTPAALARKYGVDRKAIVLILEGKNWSWVDADVEPTLPF